MSPERAILPMTPEPGHDRLEVLVEHHRVAEDADRRAALHGRLALGHGGHAVVARLRRADGVDDDEVREVLEELVLDRCREERGRRRHRQQRRQVVVRARLVERLDQRLAHGVAGDHHRVGLLRLDQAPHVVGVELRHQHRPVAHEALAHDAPLRGPVHQGGDGEEGQLAAPSLLDHLLGLLHPGVGGRVDAATEGVEDVLVAPHHALGHPGGPAGVEDVVVVARPGGEVALGGALGHGVLVADGALAEGHARVVVDADDQLEVGEVGEQRRRRGGSTRPGAPGPPGRRS